MDFAIPAGFAEDIDKFEAFIKTDGGWKLNGTKAYVTNGLIADRGVITALTLGSAVGAFDLTVNHMQKHKIFGENILSFQAKAFELSDF